MNYFKYSEVVDCVNAIKEFVEVCDEMRRLVVSQIPSNLVEF